MMDTFEEFGHPFTIPDLWGRRHPEAIEEKITGSSASDCWVLTKHGIDLGLDAEGEEVDRLINFENLNVKLPDLDNFKYDSLDNLEAHESLSPELTDGSIDERESILEISEPTEDIWSHPDVVATVWPDKKIQSWEAFNDGGFKEPRLDFISERGSLVFDAVVAAHEKATSDQSGTKKGRVMQSRPLLLGLSLLGLGRESNLFHYVESKQTFQARIENARMSGYSIESFASYSANFIHHGNEMRRITSFVDSIHSSIDLVRPLVSFASALSSILSTLQWDSGGPLKSADGLLQLQSVIYRPSLILFYVGEMKEAISRGESDHEVLSRLFRFLQDKEHTDSGLHQVGLQILIRSSNPWLGSLGRCLGIPDKFSSATSQQKRHTVSMKEMIPLSSHSFQHDNGALSIPSFIPDEDANIISSVRQGLQLIRSHSPDHPLARSDRFSVGSTPALTWQFSWQDADRIILRAKEYERSISETIKEFHNSNNPQNHPSTENASRLSSRSEVFDWSNKDFQVEIRNSMAEIETSLCESLPEDLADDSLAQTVLDYIRLSDETGQVGNLDFAPPLSLVPVISFTPIIHAQSRLVNHACLRLLFKEHNLRDHLTVQHDFSLLGDGVFATRLSHALFDPELQGAQHSRGHSRSGRCGLRLGYRDKWPPAISELRFALMGILTESFHLNDDGECKLGARRGLPGDLNFAIRDITEDELMKCLDPHSVKALDFIRLKYKAPAPLETVITPSCLDKYDQIFKLLLRGTRMLFVVNRFPRTTGRHQASARQRSEVINQRFRLEAHHIVTATCGYFFNSIRINWKTLSHKLDAIESRLDNYDGGDEYGLEKVRKFHETVLDRIMFALFLRARHEHVAKALEEIFNDVLIFARLSNFNDYQPSARKDDDDNQDREGEAEAEGSVHRSAQDIETVYARFRTRVRRFVTLCRDSSEGRGLGADGIEEFEKEVRGESRGNPIDQLVLSLEMSGFYSMRRDP